MQNALGNFDNYTYEWVTMMALTNENLREFLEFDLGVDVADVDPATLIFSSGIIDSFALVNLFTFIETEADIRINPGDVTLQNMDSIDRILAYVDRVRVH